MKDSFGARLKFFRSKAGLSQQQLAESTGLSRKIISDYEVRLDIQPRMTNIFKISQSLGIDSSNLIPKPKDFINQNLEVVMTYPIKSIDVSLISKEVLATLDAVSQDQSIAVEKIIEELVIEKYSKHYDFIKNEGIAEPDVATIQTFELEKQYFNYLNALTN